MPNALPKPQPAGEVQTGHHRVRVILDVTVKAPTLELAVEKLRADYAGVEEQALACSIEKGSPRLYPSRSLEDLERSIISLQTILSCLVADREGYSVGDPAARERIAEGVGQMFDQYKTEVAKALLKMGQRATFNEIPTAEVIQ